MLYQARPRKSYVVKQMKNAQYDTGDDAQDETNRDIQKKTQVMGARRDLRLLQTQMNKFRVIILNNSHQQRCHRTMSTHLIHHCHQHHQVFLIAMTIGFQVKA